MARSKTGASIVVRSIGGSSSRANSARTSMLFFNIARWNARSTLRVPEILPPNDWMNAKLAIDCLVLFLYFFIIIAIGLRMGRKELDLEDFALGRRQIPWWAVLASLIAAETSAGTFFGTPGEGYTQRNYTYLQLALGTIIARILVSFIFIKPYYDYKVFSIYEYLTVRFGVGTKNAASAIFLFTRFHHHRPGPGETWLGQMERNVCHRVHHFRRIDRLHFHDHVNARHGPGHGAADVDRARCAPEPAFAYHVGAGRYSDRIHLYQHRRPALGFLSNPSGPCSTEDAERNFLSLHPL